MVNNEHGDRRAYQRAALDIDAKYSADGVSWLEADAIDLSSGGIQMRSKLEYETDAVLQFDITIYGLSSEFEFRTEGAIRHMNYVKPYYSYGIVFKGLPNSTKIRIDEMITHNHPRDFLM